MIEAVVPPSNCAVSTADHPEHVAKQQRRALPGRQQLDRRDKGEPYRLASLVARFRAGPVVGNV
ncbi:hypothetical protein, partial [Mesorhizobium sp. M2A.F.Ca.ET.039.01.1.1]|uniref:hypothetical protein n=1 Tax=Mesorhizobium sp. M2A.F.Ca.ET.039.01.1.1 TaxID=2496746 RepID=UPI001FDED457